LVSCEAYRDEAAFQAHQRAPHHHPRWRAAAAECLAEPAQARTVFPRDYR
jgi:quinol monooxygenase YgiN